MNKRQKALKDSEFNIIVYALLLFLVFLVGFTGYVWISDTFYGIPEYCKIAPAGVGVMCIGWIFPVFLFCVGLCLVTNVGWNIKLRCKRAK